MLFGRETQVLARGTDREIKLATEAQAEPVVKQTKAGVVYESIQAGTDAWLTDFNRKAKR